MGGRSYASLVFIHFSLPSRHNHRGDWANDGHEPAHKDPKDGCSAAKRTQGHNRRANCQEDVYKDHLRKKQLRVPAKLAGNQNRISGCLFHGLAVL